MSGIILDPTSSSPDDDTSLTMFALHDVSALCAAIGDSSGTAVRARALWALHVHGPQNVSTLSTLLSIPHATLSGHLRTLENAGLISSQRVDGVNKIKTLNRDVLHNLIVQLNNLFFKGEE